MKKIVLLLIVIAGLYGAVGNALVSSGKNSVNVNQERMLKAGV